MRILVVEDDRRIADIIRRALTESGYPVDLRADAVEALFAFETDVYDLVLLDLMLPGMVGGGVELCRRIRSVNTDVPVLMVTAMDSTRSRVRGLDAGADDYLVKPFHLDELLARVRALLRRAPKAIAPVFAVRDVTLDTGLRRAYRSGREFPLTAKEFAVLEYLMRNAGTVVSTSDLLDHAWDTNSDRGSNVVQTYIRYLRRKLTAQGTSETEFIETRRGAGYLVRTHL
ncbi:MULTISPECIES: response regulator transcription factor [unclassified Microbacterium]|uniref:response regulator transcription factor n=1 Tax=unclassified Microbacterium TaxID=2609290 RepID=UPI00177F9656|nr:MULTISPECIES: response regulator transcription factor [unclassified Microbacterium]MBD8205864.1 response regulator transcription factor [Microbacterium sp. CFBP 8801]MBD8476701.1 response regulator transcription factor [Microbacterium sp. CFBP 8794]MBD8509438.1 response regulator transcription factor [Microbacterium sp. CFBP 8790]